MISLALLAVAAAIVYHAMKGPTDMSVARLTAAVAALTSVVDSAGQLLNNLAEEIRARVGDEDALNELADDIESNVQELSAAIAANTPASDEAADVGFEDLNETESTGDSTAGSDATEADVAGVPDGGFATDSSDGTPDVGGTQDVGAGTESDFTDIPSGMNSQ